MLDIKTGSQEQETSQAIPPQATKEEGLGIRGNRRQWNAASSKEIVRGGSRATNGQNFGPNGPLVAMLWCVEVDAPNVIESAHFHFCVAKPCFFPCASQDLPGNNIPTSTILFLYKNYQRNCPCQKGVTVVGGRCRGRQW
jgi:hypothetical protein